MAEGKAALRPRLLGRARPGGHTKLHTVCQSAQCPNLGECWSRGTATVMILGNICTRSCNFCAVQTGRPTELDLGEPARVAEAVATMGLRHCVITSVARDELADGGASVWAATIRAVRHRNPSTAIEVLVPDFKGTIRGRRHGARREARHLQPQRGDGRAAAEAGPGPGPLRPLARRPAPCEGQAASR